MKALYLVSILAVLFVGGGAIAESAPLAISSNSSVPEQMEQNPIQDTVETQVCKRFFGCW